MAVDDPRPAARRTTASSLLDDRPRPTAWPIVRCLLIWPAIFSAVVMATFLGAAIHFDDPGGPLFWPCGLVGTAIMYALFVGLPLSLCARRRRWYVRATPALLIAVPVGWIIGAAGGWAVPGALTIACSIAIETFGAHRR